MSTPAEILRRVRAFARDPYAWPGGYPCVLVMRDGEVLCHECARTEYRLISHATKDKRDHSGWAAAGVDIHWEGEPVTCAHCGKQIESAYGPVENMP